MQRADYPELDAAFGNWLAGFIDGEGSFGIVHQRRRAYGYQVRMHITLRDDDAPILWECQQRTGLGLVYQTGRVRRDATRNAKPQATWYVGALPDCHGLVELLDAHPLRAKKARDYAIWREAVLERVRATRTRDYERLEALRQQLIDVRAYRPPAPSSRPPARRGPAAKTHCRWGHKLAGENLYVGPTGGRQCATCRRDASRRATVRKRAWRAQQHVMEDFDPERRESAEDRIRRARAQQRQEHTG